MAVQRRVNWISQQRVDVPDVRAVESAASNDWDQAIQAIFTNTSQGYIIRGFEISMTGAIGGAASSLQMTVDPGALLHIAASQSGTVLMVPAGTPPQQLNGVTNSNVVGSFVPNALNYIGIDYLRFIDPTTDAQVYLWDPTTNSESTITAPRAQILEFTLSVSTTSWPANILPIAIVQTDAGNNVVSVTDCRWNLFRLGTGGASPNAFFRYPWTAQSEGRTENPSTSTSNSINPFEGGDKMLFSQKDWMNAVMTLFWEINGGTFWYSSGTAGSITKLREDVANTFTAGVGTITHGVYPNNDPVLVTTAQITAGSPTMLLASTTGLVSSNTYVVFATGVPFNTTFVFSGSSTVTMTQNATLNNPTANVSLFNPSAVSAPGQINWSDPFFLKVVGSSLSYEFLANPTSTDIILADDQVGYVTLTRDVLVTPNLFYTYNSIPNTTTVVSIGSVAWTGPLLAGDFLRAAADGDNLYTKIKTVDSLTQVTLFGNYVPVSQTAAGVQSMYSFGSYQAVASPSGPRDIFIANRSAVPSGQNVWWLFSREDLGGVNPTVYVRFIGQELAFGDSTQIGDTIPKQVLQYIGSPAESSSSPQYVSALDPGSIPQIVQINNVAASAITSGQYFVISSSNEARTYYFWFKKDGIGTDPAPNARWFGVEVDISTGQTSVQVGNQVAAAFNTTVFPDFSVSNPGTGILTVTNNSAGSTIPPSVGTMSGGFSILATQNGTGRGNNIVNDGDNLTLGIKKLDEAYGTIVQSLNSPGYEEYWQVASGTPVILASNTTVLGTASTGISANTLIEQPFQVSSNGTAGQLQVYLAHTGPGLFNITAYIYTDSAGLPGTLLATSTNNVPVTSLTGSPTPINFAFTAPALVTGTVYHFVLGATSFVASGALDYNVSSTYTYGLAEFSNGGLAGPWASIGSAVDFILTSTSGLGPNQIAGPISSGTNITIPLNSRLPGTPQEHYTVGQGNLEVFLNGQYLLLGSDWAEVGASGTSSYQIQILENLVLGDYLEFLMVGGGAGGGVQGPPGPPGPAGPAGADAIGGPIAVSTKTSNYAVLTTDNVLLADCTSGPITFTLPLPPSATGHVWFFKKVDSSANAMSIIAAGGANIDGSPTLSTSVQYEAFTVVTDGTQYWIL